MWLKTILWMISFVLLSTGVQAQEVLQHKLHEAEIDKLIDGIADWRRQKLVEWQQIIDQLPDEEKQKAIRSAEDVQDFDWPSLLATQYMEYKLNGNRTNYEQSVNKRRNVLSRLIIDLIMGHIYKD